MTNHIMINDALRATLKANGIAPEDYTPSYGGESAALDLYYTGTEPYFLFKSLMDAKVLIPTGLHIALPTDKVALIRERGSIVKTKMISRAGVIDAGYTDEIFVNLVHLGGRKGIEIPPQSKLPVQLLVVPVFNTFRQVDPDEWEYLTSTARRREGQVGSSD